MTSDGLKERDALDPEQIAIGRGDHGCRARRIDQQRDLAETLGATHCPDERSADEDVDGAAGDHVVTVTTLTLLDDRGPGWYVFDRASPGHTFDLDRWQ